MQLKYFFILIAFFLFTPVKGQNLTPYSKESKPPKKYMIIEEDSLVVSEIELDEVVILQKLNFNSKKELRDYLILKRKTRKVWPYAILASQRLEMLTERLSQIESKRKRKKYTKRIQKYVEGKFTDELKKLTKTEGQILVKLMHRQTGMTTFDLVKDLKSGWRAFWYNTTANLFNISLKEKYNPYEIKEDYLIEDILQRSFTDGVLEKQKPAIDIEYLEIVEHWSKK